jgi:hypothetical protein
MLIGTHIVIVFSMHFIFCSYLYSNQITSIQEGAFSNVRPEPVPGFLTLYVVVFIVVSDFEVRGVFYIDGIVDHHGAKTIQQRTKPYSTVSMKLFLFFHVVAYKT